MEDYRAEPRLSNVESRKQADLQGPYVRLTMLSHKELLRKQPQNTEGAEDEGYTRAGLSAGWMECGPGTGGRKSRGRAQRAACCQGPSGEARGKTFNLCYCQTSFRWNVLQHGISG